MKKSIVLLLSLIMVITLVSCGGTSTSEGSDIESESTNKDMEIITRENHPTYYGSAEDANKLWKDVKEKVLLPESTRSYDDNTILVVDAQRNSDLISNIEINLNHFETNPNLTIEEVLPIVYTYLPIDIIKEYYEYKGSTKIVPTEENAEGATSYVVSYRLTDSASEGYYNGEHNYSGSIDVIIEADEDIVSTARITFGTPKWMGFLEKNGFQEEEWEYDFLK